MGSGGLYANQLAQRRREKLLSKILSIKGVGLLNDAKAMSGKRLLKRTLIYAENGRGKSTLSAVLASCATRNSDLIEERRTLNSDNDPEVSLLFDSSKSEFTSGAWTGHQPQILVFDGNFVEQNVHAGNAVTSSQRANLLDFALGVSAVQARNEAEAAAQDEREEKQNLKALNSKLEGLLNGRMSAGEFRQLPKEADVSERIIAARNKIEAQRRADEINRLPIPVSYSIQAPRFDEIDRALRITMAKVHEEAAVKVSERIDSLGDSGAKDWIQQGLTYVQKDDCPFCGQDTSDLDLVRLYRLYFDQTYHDNQDEVARVASAVLTATAPDVLTKLKTTRRQNNERIEAWKPYIDVRVLPDDVDEQAAKAIADLHELVRSYFDSKKANLSEVPASDDDIESMKVLWSKFSAWVSVEETKIQAVSDAAEKYKEELKVADVTEQAAELNRLQLASLRQDKNTVDLIREIEDSEKKIVGHAEATADARNVLNDLMDQTLGQYMEDINNHLASLGAEFRIAEFKPDYRAKSPRVQYWLTLKGKRVALDGGVPNFSTALSEGDKRTMAFAFFAASTLGDSDLENKIVVVDDPMSSLDASRRMRTIEIIDDISSRCKQLILTAHDEYFLQEARDVLRATDDSTEFTELTLIATPGEYSDFSAVDIDELCASTYLTHYKQVSAVVNSTATTQHDVATAARALRPLLEGYLYRKFPETLPRGGTLGEAITTIVGKGNPSPMYAAVAKRERELRKWNGYVSQFHHDTKSDYLARAQRAQRAEVSTYGREILEFIHSA